ncbi:MAG: PA2779 family protein [Acidobacteria bacterium]|nr:PA2779 family protein [Acidobacteriota bacterium]
MYKGRFVPACALFLCLGPQNAIAAEANDHVVPLREIERQLDNRSRQRRANLDKLDAFLEMGRVQQALTSVKLDARDIRTAAAVLSDAELAKLASRSSELKADIEGGALNNTELTYIVIALVTALVVVIIFVA